MKKYVLSVVILLMVLGTVWLLAETITRPEATSSDGLKVSYFVLKGDLTGKGRYSIKFRLTNMTDHDITFHPDYGVFLGARRNSANIDFGHMAKGQTISPGAYINMKATNRFTGLGTYVFWPAYHANGHWGPYKWNAITVNIVE